MTEPLPDRALRRLLLDAAASDRDADQTLVLGRYRIVREVGRGGMGTVFEALDLELNRRVAVKRIHASIATPVTLERLLREARAAARLDHQNIAAVIDVDDGVLVMQIVDGVPLDVAARSDVRRAIAFVRDAALAAHFAHEHGIIHRDLKPQNLLVQGDRVFVTDFGLAKDLRAQDGQISRSGHVLGTPAMMAPEQAQGRVHEVDARTDVWGLGATLYQALTGRPPFVDDDVVQLLRRVVDDEPARPRMLRRELSRDVENVILKCLAKERSQRFASAADLAADLDRVLAGKPVLAKPPTLAHRAARLVARHRNVAIGAALATLAMLCIGAAAWHERGRREASDEALALSSSVYAVLQDAAEQQRLGDVTRGRERIQDGIDACRAFLRRHDVSHAHYLLGRLLRARGDDESALAELGAALTAEPELIEARLERGLAAARSWTIDATNAGGAAAPARYEQALADLAASRDSTRLRHLDRIRADAEHARLEGDLARAQKGQDEVLRIDPLSIDARLSLAQLELARGDGDAAWRHAMSVLDLYRGFGPAYLAKSAATAATSSTDPAARAALQHGLAAAEQRIAAGDASSAAFHERGGIRLHIDDVDGALADFSRAVAADPRDAMAFGNRGLVHARRATKARASGDLDAAVSAWECAIDDTTAALTIEPTLLGALNNRGLYRVEHARALAQLHRADAARRAQGAARADFDAAIAADPSFALARLNRAQWWRREAEALAQDLDSCARALTNARFDLDVVLTRRADDAFALLELALCADLEARACEAHGAFAAADAALLRARDAFDLAVAAAPMDARPLGMRGLHRLRAHDRDGGTTDMSAALKLAPDGELEATLRTALRRD